MRSPNDEPGRQDSPVGRQLRTIDPSDGVARLSVLVACAAVLQVAESLFPHPLPGVRLGLANVVTVISLVYIGPGVAIQLAVLRTLVSSMVLGTFLTPTFVLSFTGGVVSALVMVLLYRFSGHGQLSFGLVGISVGGAVSHILTQLVLVYFLFVRSGGVLWFWPWLCIAAVATGILTGLVAVQAVKRLEDGVQGAKESGVQVPGIRDCSTLEPQCPRPSPIGGLRPELKIAGAAVVGLAVVLFSDWRLYAAVFGLLAAAAVLGRVSSGRLVAGLKRVWLLLVVALAMPVVFSPWGRVLFEFGALRVTDKGLHDGAVFASRILLLFFTTSVLAQTTAPRELVVGLERLLRPLRAIRVRPDRLARAFGLAWSCFPQFWQSVRQMAGENRGRRGWLNRVIRLPGDIVAGMFRLADQGAASAQDGRP